MIHDEEVLPKRNARIIRWQKEKICNELGQEAIDQSTYVPGREPTRSLKNPVMAVKKRLRTGQSRIHEKGLSIFSCTEWSVWGHSCGRPFYGDVNERGR